MHTDGHWVDVNAQSNGLMTIFDWCYIDVPAPTSVHHCSPNSRLLVCWCSCSCCCCCCQVIHPKITPVNRCALRRLNVKVPFSVEDQGSVKLIPPLPKQENRGAKSRFAVEESLPMYAWISAIFSTYVDAHPCRSDLQWSGGKFCPCRRRWKILSLFQRHINCARYSHFWVFDSYGNRPPWTLRWDEMRFGVECANSCDAFMFFGLYTTLKIDILNERLEDDVPFFMFHVGFPVCSLCTWNEKWWHWHEGKPFQNLDTVVR